MSHIRVRIAPSPTGLFHVGTARAALFNYLFAKNQKGVFIVRIEDTDRERSKREFEDDILDSLDWLGITADESPRAGGDYGPYRQSERTELYRTHLTALLEKGNAFYCFHSHEEREQEREERMKDKKPPVHFCEYREKGREEQEALLRSGKEYIVRFKTPKARIIEFHDLVRGKMEFRSDLLGDFSIAKKIDEPLYNFAAAIDDSLMKISHVIRGEDHISNTPKQILLFEAFGLPVPEYAHLPLLLAPDRSKLSKRHGATSVSEYKEDFLPEALFNFLALLGWNPGDEQEIFSKDELTQKFSLEKVQKSGAIFDIQKLLWMNGEYIRNKPLTELVERVKPFLEKSGLLQFSIFNSQFSKDEYIAKIVALEQPRLKRLSEIKEKTDYFFRTPSVDKELLRWKNMSDDEIAEALDKSIKLVQNNKERGIGELKTVFLEEAEKMGDRGKLLWPLRAALSGKKASPDPFEIIEVMGISEAQERLKRARVLFP